jgi:single-strand selective monofunctional uracil DNA glycosylase
LLALATFARMPQREPSASLIQISRRLARAVDALPFGSSVPYVYNPLAYARVPHELYLDKWGQGPKRVLLLGMNPGPFGMAQTGVPFGDVPMVRDFLGIQGQVARPPHEHPDRPIEGFACSRREVSGTRLWGWVESHFKTPSSFFERFFVANYCPLVFMEQGGRNLTPDKLPKLLTTQLFAACDEALRAQVELLAPDWVIGIGAFAEGRAREALGLPRRTAKTPQAASGAGLNVGTILHPSPASPLANRGWAEQVETKLRALGILTP